MRWLVFSRVVDNFGDIGFAWRLAADLAGRGEAVRLVVDDPRALAWLAPGGMDGVEVLRPGDALAGPTDVVVETFGCGVPGHFAATRESGAVPAHVDVQHLSAEAYTERSHGLSLAATVERPRPLRLFYPGFTPAAGGLLREPGLLARRDAFLAARAEAGAAGDEEQVSLFCYAGEFVGALLDALPHHPTRIVCAPGAATAAALAWQSRQGPNGRGAGLPAGLRIVAAPFIAQPLFDERLWASGLNVVRGEDSLVRALWAARPFVWQIYPQADGAHRAKLEAFLDHFLDAAESGLAGAVRELFRRCNGVTGGPLRLPPLAPWQDHCGRFADRLAARPDLTTQLLQFIGEVTSASGP